MGVRSDTSLLQVADLGCGESITVDPSVPPSITRQPAASARGRIIATVPRAADRVGWQNMAVHTTGSFPPTGSWTSCFSAIPPHPVAPLAASLLLVFSTPTPALSRSPQPLLPVSQPPPA